MQICGAVLLPGNHYFLPILGVKLALSEPHLWLRIITSAVFSHKPASISHAAFGWGHFHFYCWDHIFCVVLSALSPVRCGPLLRPCAGDLLAVLHPEAFLMGGVSSGEAAVQGNWYAGWFRRQDDLLRGIDLGFWNTETVKPYHRTGARSMLPSVEQ